jgi:predicted PurR-regulated permease PerM
VTDKPQASPPPATREEVAAWILAGIALVFVFARHLVPALVAGLLVQLILHVIAKRLHGPWLSAGLAKAISVMLLGLVAASLTAGAVILVLGLLRGRLGDLPALFEAMAEALEKIHARLGAAGFLVPALDAEELQVLVSARLKEHGGLLGRAGGEMGRVLVHTFMGILVSLLVFFRRESLSRGPLAAALSERVRRFTDAFETIVRAQAEISAINTALTAVFLLAVLPLLGARLPLAGTVLVVTFLSGMIPIAGNLVSNTVIVVLSLSVSPWIGAVSLVFLVVIHKLEYVLNARIVGRRIGAAAWETLLAIVVFEVVWGIPGVVLAPVVYAYAKKELSDRHLV